MENNDTEYSYIRVEQPFEETKNYLYEDNSRLDFINIEKNKIIYLSHNDIVIEVPLSEIGNNSLYRLMSAQKFIDLNLKDIKFYRLKKEFKNNKMESDA